MNSGHLNEHDANQGAQSTGEFLGMTGNSAWYLLGSSGASVMLVIVLWGMLGLSLLLCLLPGVVLCGLSVAYVFGLKNNRPEHYDSDFFESSLVEAGVLALAFGPRAKRLPNPFRSVVTVDGATRGVAMSRGTFTPSQRRIPGTCGGRVGTMRTDVSVTERKPGREAIRQIEDAPTVPLAAYDRLQTELNATTEMLEDALSEREEDGV